MPGVKAMIHEAEKSLGIHGRPNDITKDYAARNGSGFRRQPWCNMAITEWARRSGNHKAVCFSTDYAYTVWHAERFKRAGRWTADVRGVRRGDIVFFDWNGSNRVAAIDHIGIVTKVANGVVYTIEGNTSDRCARRTRSAATIVGYGRPNYAGGGGSTGGGGAQAWGGLTTVRSVRSQQQAVNYLRWLSDLPVSGHVAEDGEGGPETLRGVRWVQGTVKTEVDGQWGAKTESAFTEYLKGNAKHQMHIAAKVKAPSGSPALRLGSVGTRVARLQRALMKAGHRLPRFGADGEMGAETVSALKAFQRAADLVADGEYDAESAAALKKVVG
ncbi:peptidoglycan hydrolase-like protein with peptidoglycan-binding domain [Murinocardiopsis flavida]|uniref:Peptidoglycan hydrolase-like protein with peptidoglycan-binding domain n=1 Tax=Murinocardiopsis flavida TaxID=645275 RepID=A0A2P8DUW4_9ACTN|nr:peptidoglycan-binding protein [Murinocardiopsis flavida]PSL01012.1 peptidoglycan hydrolase-like protein with peptidoglycan-binding domain [Murinocardiopsis flavida]